MAKIRVDLIEPLLDGMSIKFKAPCDCTAVTGLVVYYPGEDSVELNHSFVFKDVHGNILTGIGNLFVKDSYVNVIVDTVNGVAYLQNADTNGYLEAALESKLDRTGGVMTGSVTLNGIVLTKGVDYGPTLPSPGTPGRIFFKKVTG